MAKRRKNLSPAEQEKERDEETAQTEKQTRRKGKTTTARWGEAQRSPAEAEDDSLNDKQYLKDYILNCKQEAEEATSDIWTDRRELWNIYQNKQDFKGKESWQSQLVLPKLFMVVERASLLIKRAILQVDKLFSMQQDPESIAPLKKIIKHARKQLKLALVEHEEMMSIGADSEKVAATKSKALALHAILTAAERALDEQNDIMEENENKFKSHLKPTKSNFVAAFCEMIKCAVLLGFGCIKRVWNPVERIVEFENVDLFNLYIAPDFQPFQRKPPRYLIEFMRIPLCDLYELAQTTNDEYDRLRKEVEVQEDSDWKRQFLARFNKPPFDIDEINSIQPEESKTDDKETARRGLTNYKRITKEVNLLLFWGKVISKDGKKSKPNQLMALANEKHLIRIQDNPFSNARPTYNFWVPLIYPHRGVAGNSLVGAEAKTQYTLNNLLNLVLDNQNWVVNKMFEYNPLELNNPRDMLRLYPAKKISTKISGRNVLREVPVKPISGDVFKMIELLKSELQEGTAMTEFLQGMPGKTAKTLGEIEIKTTESQGYFDVIVRDCEVNCLTLLLADTYDMLCQFRDDFFGKYGFNVGGLSVLLLQKDQQEKLIQSLTIAMKNPTLGKHTRITDAWKRLLDLWDFGDLFMTEDELIEQQPQSSQMAATMPTTGEQIQQQAAEQAHKVVAQMNPQEILRFTPSRAA